MFKKFVTFVTAAALIAAIAVPAMPAFAATKPDTPASVWWDEDKPTTAVWEAADHATRYEVYLYRVSDSGSPTKVKDVKVTKTQYNFSRDFNKEGDYVFKVRSLGSGSTSSSWTEESDSHYVTEAYASWVRDGMPAKNDSNSGPGVATALNQGTGTTSESASGPMQPDWRRNDKGWWYATTAAGDAWYASCWQWIDGNKDGIAECYCFDADGYMYENTTTPDGYTVNADGAWTVDGVVQTKAAE